MRADTFKAPYGSRKARNFLFSAVVIVPSLAVALVLGSIFAQITINGVKALNPDFFLKSQKPMGEAGGGIAQGIIGTLLLLAIAAMIAVPLSLAAALYLNERGKRGLGKALDVAVGALQGIPSIVIGVVIYGWIVMPMRHFSALAGGAALSLIMVPTVTSAIREALAMVPPSLGEAAAALGVPHWRGVLGVILPAAGPGILNGIGLGIARAAGETAPLLFTAFGSPYVNLDPGKPTSALPLVIYEYIKSPYDDWHRIAWGAAFILALFIMAINVFISLRKKAPHRA